MNTWQTSVRPTATPYSVRTPAGMVFYTDTFGNIYTDLDGNPYYKEIVDTPWTTNRGYTGQTWDDLLDQTWNDLGDTTWDDLFTGIAPASYNVRTPV